MNKSEFIEKVLKEAHSSDRPVNKTDVEKVWEGACNVARKELLAGGEISLPGLGKLKVKETSAREGRNPRTGEVIEIPAGKKVVFVPGSAFKSELDK